MRSKDYIPATEVEMIMWANTMMEYAKLHYEVWGVPSPETIIGTALIDFSKKQAITMDTATCTRNDIVEKRALKRELIKLLRGYVQGFVAKNPLVSDTDREKMGLKVRDTVMTPIGLPEGQAEATISYPGRNQLQLHIRHLEGTPYNEKANYGCRIYYGVYDHGQQPPAKEEDLRESRFSRQKRVLFSFRSVDAGKMAWFSIRYENGKGETGQWGPMFSAIIP